MMQRGGIKSKLDQGGGGEGGDGKQRRGNDGYIGRSESRRRLRKAASSRFRHFQESYGSEDAEDVPLVVDEDGNVVSHLEVDKDGVVVKDSQDHGLDGSAAAFEKETTKESESKVSIGGRKRKVGKVIGESADEPAEKDAAGKGGKQGDAKEGTKDRKPKKKPKKIKLSFDEDEG
ncbi:hypothetical protein AUP68_17777 [Ilyonectria robusta]